MRTDLRVNNNDIESFIDIDIESFNLILKILFEKKCNTLINVLYRPPSGLILPFQNFLKDVFNKTKNSNKMLHIAGGFNMNLLDYEKCKKVQEFLNLIYENSMIPTINKPTRVMRQSDTATDHIPTNCFVNFDFKTTIFKSDISDHFPISFFLPMTN